MRKEITSEDFEKAREELEKNSISPEKYIAGLSDKDKKRMFGFIKKTKAWKELKKTI